MRWIVRLLGAVLSLVVIVVAALFLIPAERVAGIAAERFEAATGRALTIGGTARPSVWPVIGARIEDVRLANAPWSDAGPMFTAEVVDLGLDLRALMAGDIVITRFEAVAPSILLERDDEGRSNWNFAAPDASPDASPNASGTPEGEARALSLALAQFSEGRLRIRDRAAGVELDIEDLDLELRVPDWAGPGTLHARGQSGGQAFTGELRIETVQRFLDGGVSPLAIRAQAGGSTLRFDGRAGGDPFAGEGRISIEGDRFAPFLALAGLGAEEPLPAEFRPFALSGQATLAPEGTWHLRDGQVRLGPNRLTAALDLALEGPRPRLTGEVVAETVNLSAFGGANGEAAEGDGWSRAPIDVSAINLFDAALDLRADAVETEAGLITPLRMGLTIDRARAVFDLREVGIHDGALRGEFVINNRSGLSVGGDLRAEDMALLPLARRLTGYERLTGTGAVGVRFLGVGQSVDAIMRSLSGEGQLELDHGELVGLDLAGMLRNLDMSYIGDRNRTLFESLRGSFTLEGGVLRNDDLQLNARAITAEGRGAVDLGARTLDYRLIPIAARDPETGRAIRIPLHITGPWEEPRFRLDLEELAEERLRQERARLEDLARDELERRLGIERQEGQSARDALRDGARERLEQELGRGINRLLRSRD